MIVRAQRACGQHESCGHQQEFLQKVSDPPLKDCTECGKPTFAKMLTAAGFQLKGSGWYATDFKSKGSSPAKKGSLALAAAGNAARFAPAQPIPEG